MGYDPTAEFGALGHSIIVWTFLEAQGVPSVVSDVALDAAQGAVTRIDNAELTNLSVTETGVSFLLLEKALPFPILARPCPHRYELKVL